MAADWRDILGQLFNTHGGEGWAEFVDYLFVHLGPPGRGDFRDSCRVAAEAFQQGQPGAAMDSLYALCEHSFIAPAPAVPILDLLDTRASAHYLACDGYPGRARVEKLMVESPEARWADALLFLGAPKQTLAFYEGQASDLRSANSLGLAFSLLGDLKSSVHVLRDALDLPEFTPLQKVPVSYNLAQQLFCTAHLHEALAEFKRCRSSYPHYRQVLKWIAGIRQILDLSSGPRGSAMTLPAPFYSRTKAVAESAG
jgi:hypothetical protein